MKSFFLFFFWHFSFELQLYGFVSVTFIGPLFLRIWISVYECGVIVSWPFSKFIKRIHWFRKKRVRTFKFDCFTMLFVPKFNFNWIGDEFWQLFNFWPRVVHGILEHSNFHWTVTIKSFSYLISLNYPLVCN